VPELNPDINRLTVTVVEISDPTIADQGIERINQDAGQLTIALSRAKSMEGIHE
jgi:hypothetical protein